MRHQTRCRRGSRFVFDFRTVPFPAQDLVPDVVSYLVPAWLLIQYRLRLQSRSISRPKIWYLCGPRYGTVFDPKAVPLPGPDLLPYVVPDVGPAWIQARHRLRFHIAHRMVALSAGVGPDLRRRQTQMYRGTRLCAGPDLQRRQTQMYRGTRLCAGPDLQRRQTQMYPWDRATARRRRRGRHRRYRRGHRTIRRAKAPYYKTRAGRM
jgi:hypothetical protein